MKKEFTLAVKAKSVEKIDEVYKALAKIEDIEVYILMKLPTRDAYEASKDVGKHYEKI